MVGEMRTLANYIVSTRFEDHPKGEGIIKTVERLEKLEDISELAELLHN